MRWTARRKAKLVTRLLIVPPRRSPRPISTACCDRRHNLPFSKSRDLGLSNDGSLWTVGCIRISVSAQDVFGISW
jgi:hypothetical protein